MLLPRFACLALFFGFLPLIGFSENLTTKLGKTYYDIEAVSNRCDLYHVFIKHKAGTAKVPFSEMTDKDRAKYGFNPERIAQVEADLKRQKELEQKKADAIQREKAEAVKTQEKVRNTQEKLEANPAPKAPAIDMDKVHRIEASLGLTVSELSSISHELDMNVESLQVLILLARDTGATTQDMLDGLRNLKESKRLVAAGDKGKIAAFRRMGIRPEDVISLPLDKLFEQVAKGYVRGNN